MSFQFYQMALLGPGILFVVVAWKVRPIKLKIAILVIMALAALFNPIRFKQEGGAVFEKFTAVRQTVPSRVEVQEKDFCETQKSEMNQLKRESMEVRNEEIN